MNVLSKEATLSELKGLENALKECFETLVEPALHSFNHAYFDMEMNQYNLFYDDNQAKGKAGKKFKLSLQTMNCQDITYTMEKNGEEIQLKQQRVNYFTLNCPDTLHQQVKSLFPLDPIEEAENAALLELENMDSDFSHEDDSEKCNCGGTILPMYEEHPSWIRFCNKCDIRTENGDFSPLPY